MLQTQHNYKKLFTIAFLALFFSFFAELTQAQTISSISPSKACVGGTVNLTGSGFTGATSVTFGSTTASFTIVSSGSITVTVPNNLTAGTSYNIKVGSGTPKSGFSCVTLPTVSNIVGTGISANSGSTTAVSGIIGGTITISGGNFTSSGTSLVSSLTINGINCLSVATVGVNSIAINSNSLGLYGSFPFQLTIAGKTFTTTNNFSCTPTVTGLSTSDFASAPIFAGTDKVVTITGSGFTGATAVTFGNTAATDVSVISNNSITAKVASGASGTVAVTTSGGTNTTSPSFTFVSPSTVASFNPASAKTGSTVTISGTNFVSGAIKSVQFGGTNAASFTVDNSTTISAVIAAGASGSVTVTTVTGTYTSPGLFTYLAVPTISSLSSYTIYGGDVITITGTNFSGTTDVQFGGVSAASFTVVSSSSITATVPSGVVGAADVTVVNPSATSNIVSSTVNNKWTGTHSSDWSDALNWTAGIKPDAEEAYVPSGLTTNPILSGDEVINNLKLDGTLAINGNTLYLENTPTGSGSFIGSTTSTLQMDGTGTVKFVSGNNDLLNLYVTGSMTLGNALNLYGNLNVGSGTFNTGGFLTLKNTSYSQNAMVATVGGTITGNVTAERFIPKSTFRPFIDLSPIVYGGTIFNNWQEGGVNTNGYGLKITGIKGYLDSADAVKGFDASPTGNGSMQTYTDTGWAYPTSTKPTVTDATSMILDPTKGYRVLARGNRAQSLFSAQPKAMTSDVILRTTGTLVTGDVTYTTSGVTSANGFSSSNHLHAATGSFSFIGNPYASTVSWASMLGASDIVGNPLTKGITRYYYYLDPNDSITPITGTNLSTVSKYVSYIDYGDGTYTNSDDTKSNISDNIQPGQGFFIQQDGSGTSPVLVIPESAKTAGNGTTAIFGVKTQLNKLLLNLFRDGKSVDGTVTAFKASFSKAIGKGDCPKLFNSGENLMVNKGNRSLSISGFGLPSASDTINLQLFNTAKNYNYQLKFNANQFNGNGFSAVLNDSYLSTSTKIASDSTLVSFTTSNDSATNVNRFYVTFVPITLPVTSIVVKASPTSSNYVMLTWTSLSTNVSSFVIQRSSNGRDYVNVATVNSGIKSFTDSSVLSGQLYYRVKAINVNESVGFSDAVSVSLIKANSGIVVYPNPVYGSYFNIELNQAAKGNYSVQLYSVLGKKVFAKEVSHTGGKFNKTISVDSKLAAGTYFIKLTGDNGLVYQKEIAVK